MVRCYGRELQKDLQEGENAKMKLVRTSLLVFGVAGAVLVAGCSKKKVEGTVVARVGPRTITLEQVEEKYRSMPAEFKPKEKGLAGLKEILDTMIKKELLALAAQDSIGELSDRQKRRLERRTQYIMYDVLQKREIRRDLEVSESEIEDFYEKLKIGFRPRHILVRSLAEANEIMKLLSEGAVFEALAMEKSIDRRTYANGGDMGLIRVGDTPPEFEKALWNMKVGETVGPIKTDLGYHIIRLEDKREVPVPPLDEKLKEQIKNKILAIRARNNKSALMKKIKDTITVKYHPEAMALIDRRFTELWKREDFLKDPVSAGTPGIDPSGWFPKFDEIEMSLPLLTVADSTITLGQWAQKIMYAPATMWPKGGGVEWVQDHLENFFSKEILMAYAEAVGLRKDPEVIRKRDLAREEMLVNTFYRTRVDTVAAPTDEEVWDYYEANLSTYSLPDDLLQATLLHFKDEESARKALEDWKGGMELSALYKKYYDAGVLTEWEPSAKYFRSNTEDVLFNACWQHEQGEIFGPVELFGEYLVIRMEGKTPEGPIPFEYARERVRNDILAQRKEARLQEIIEDLKKKYPVEVHEEVLKRSKLASEKQQEQAGAG